MAMPGARRSHGVFVSLLFQFVLFVTSVYFVFYFLSTLSMIIYKSYVLSYPDDILACDVCLLFLLAALEALRLFFGVKGNLMAKNSYVVANLFLTGTTIVLAVYYLAWQAYVLRADVIISSILLVAYGLSGLLASITVTRFVSAYS